MKISAVLIGKNEEQMLPRVMESLKGIDEIIYCDTGSKDKSVEIAKKYATKTGFYQWDDSFANARNAAKKMATGDWILSIDCDEILHSLDDVYEAARLGEAAGVFAINCKLIAEDSGDSFMFPRLFKNAPEVWWEGAAHNHLSVNSRDFGNVMITHGYSPAHLLDPERTFRILKKAYKENPTPRNTFYLAREYFYRNDFEETVKLLGEYVQKSIFASEQAEAFLMMARAYWQMSMGEDARLACIQAIRINPHFKEALLFMAEIVGDGRGNEKWQSHADQWKRMAETANNDGVLFVRT